ncbi:MAG TPA: 1-acyl-sn-glycerol-3-phosphate acyltransferase [Bacteroidetes bacterium]|nr:1-acyl-sn-glycerol-3-phosphate acyltransferase [Bacteroidota bacterium]
MGKFRAILRFIAFASVAALYIVRYLFISIFKGIDLQRGILHRQRMMKWFIRITGAQIERRGNVPKEAALLVSNHRSYFDPMPILQQVVSLIVVKSQVSHWPVIGLGLKLSGVFFVERENKESRRHTREQMAKAIRDGHSLLVYPEGTTHKNPTTIKFKIGGFVGAAAEGIPVIPIAMEYQNPNDAWVGDDTFVRHFLECYSKPKSYIRLHYGDPIRSKDPEELLRLSQKWIDEKLLELRKDWIQLQA